MVVQPRILRKANLITELAKTNTERRQRIFSLKCGRKNQDNCFRESPQSAPLGMRTRVIHNTKDILKLNLVV